MKLRTKARLWYAAFALVTAFVIAFGCYTGQVMRPSAAGAEDGGAHYQASGGEGQNEPPETLWQRTISDPVALFTAVLAFFTAILAIGTIGLALSTRKLVVGAEDTAKRQLKAYIGMREAHMEFKGSLNWIAIKIEVFNAGSTPANHLRFGMAAAVKPAESYERIDSEIEMSGGGGTLLVPGAGSTLNGTLHISNAEREALRKDKSVILIACRIDFTDVFGEERYYAFSLINQAMPSGVNIWGVQPSKYSPEAN